MASRRSILRSIISSPIFLVNSPLSFANSSLFADANVKSTNEFLAVGEHEFDRELQCKLSDFQNVQLGKFQWRYAGQQYTESKDTLWLNEGERIRVKIVNDLSETQAVELNGLSMRFSANGNFDTKKIVKKLATNSNLEMEIIAGNPMMNAYLALGSEVVAIKIRVCDQPHPLVA